MAEQLTSNYEGMFLLSQAAAADFGAAVDHIREILGRADVQIIAMQKWDERRFAFEIRKQKRGVYILVYFTCGRGKLAQIERDCNLSENILRVLVTRADHLSEEEMKSADARDELATEAALRRERAEKRAAERAEDEAPDADDSDDASDEEEEAEAAASES